MSAALLVLMLSTNPLQWGEPMWSAMSPTEQSAWVGGVMTGLAIAAYLYEDDSLRVRAELFEISTRLIVFYGFPANARIPMGDAFLELSGKMRAPSTPGFRY